MHTSRSFLAVLLLAGTTLSGCSSSRNITNDVNSSNPAIAEQARKVEALQSQVQEQSRVTEAEETKLKALRQQLAGAESNLKGVKLQHKSN